MAAITTFKRAKIFQPFDALPGNNTINREHVKRPSARKTEKTESPISF